jgi:hypothetical protein
VRRVPPCAGSRSRAAPASVLIRPVGRPRKSGSGTIRSATSRDHSRVPVDLTRACSRIWRPPEAYSSPRSGWSLAFDAATYFAGAALLLALRIRRDLTLPDRHFFRELREGLSSPRTSSAVRVRVGPHRCGAGSGLQLRQRRHLPLPAVPDAPRRDAGDLPDRPAHPAARASCAGRRHRCGGLRVRRGGGALRRALGRDDAQEISSEQLSRVYSYDALGSFIVIPLGAAVAGPVADTIGTAETLVASALVIILSTAHVLLVDEVRSLRRRAGRQET